MDKQRLEEIFARFPQQTILVVGDFFLDKYLRIDPALGEVSLETSLEAHQVVEVRCSPGAAGTITNNLRAMEVNVIGLGAIGDDGEGYELKRALKATGVDTARFVERSDRCTPTYAKPIYRDHDGQVREMDRFDSKNRQPPPPEVETELIERLRQIVPRVQGVIIADQVQEPNCGVITDNVREELAVLAGMYPGTLFGADSRERIGQFRNVLIKPNAREATRALYPDREKEVNRAGLEACGTVLFRRNAKPVLLTMGANGILVFHAGGTAHVPACPVEEPIDIVGAGDSTMAGIVAALCSGADVCEAARVGTLAAAVTIRQLGTTGTASRAQMAECFAKSEPRA